MSATEYVTFKGGLTVPVTVLRLLWELWDRGVRISVKDAHTLLVGPRDLITDTDRAALKRWKPHVIALISYQADEHIQ